MAIANEPIRAEETTRRLQALTRRAYRLGRVFPSALDVAYGPESNDMRVATSNIGDPTSSVAIDARKEALRATIDRAAALIDVADRATRQALDSIQRADRLPGERVGRTWDVSSAQEAEDRTARRRAARQGGRRRQAG